LIFTFSWKGGLGYDYGRINLAFGALWAREVMMWGVSECLGMYNIWGDYLEVFGTVFGYLGVVVVKERRGEVGVRDILLVVSTLG